MSYTPPIFATDGAALPSPLLVVPAGGSDGTDARAIATDTSGRQKVLLYDSAGTPIVLVGGRVPVDGSGVTQPISAASLPLPTGASTAAKQPAIGVAGTPSADVLSIQGEAGMTPIAITGSITATNPSVGTDLTVAPTSDTLIGLKYLTTRPAPTNGQMVAAGGDAAGNLLTAPVVTSGGVQRQLVQCNLMAVGAVSTTAGVTVLTGSPGYAIAGIIFSLNNPIFTSDANLLLELVDSSTGVIFEAIFPAYTVNNPDAVTFNCPFLWNNKTANSTLKVILNAALVAGNIVFNINYALLPYVG